MAKIDWLTPYAALTAVASYPAPLAAIRDAIAVPLFAFGTVYDAAWSGAIDTAKTATPTLTATLVPWAAATSAMHTAADRAARAAEVLQVVANTGKDPTPNRHLLDGAFVPVLPTLHISFTDSVDPALRSGVTLSSVLRIESTWAGLHGNVATATVSNSTRTSPDPTTGIEYFKLTVVMGGLAEVYDDVAVGTALGTSALIHSSRWYAATRPANGTASFGGGAGGSLADLTTRLTRAERLPAASAYAAELALLRAALATQWASRPTTRGTVSENAYTAKRFAVVESSPPFVSSSGTAIAVLGDASTLTLGATGVPRELSVAEVEDEITPLIVRAEALRALVTYS